MKVVQDLHSKCIGLLRTRHQGVQLTILKVSLCTRVE